MLKLSGVGFLTGTMLGTELAPESFCLSQSREQVVFGPSR